jgi:nucleoside 2-deoxyribosyltransferase
MMPVGYVAGPFRGPTHWAIAENIRAAERLALEVWKLGAACICPHANTAHFQDAAPDELWLDGDLAMLARCDFVLMTPDWERSAGARAEREFATARGIPVFYDIDALKARLSEGWYCAYERAPRDAQGNITNGP